MKTEIIQYLSLSTSLISPSLISLQVSSFSVICVQISFHLKTEKCPLIWIDHIFLHVCSPMDGELGHSYILTIVTNAVTNMGILVTV